MVPVYGDAVISGHVDAENALLDLVVPDVSDEPTVLADRQDRVGVGKLRKHKSGGVRIVDLPQKPEEVVT